ncbi:hypothetical protein C1H87_05975 [Flavivirga eckloniae]|uniref:Uncharacterized protein n=1 Tax=Flavivirga eckloniae TaxID=1803846 RepID=A0A2K9PMM6_9FLAO|nr:hypothetical protein C1H87_05975 [Flavivirga eckloniae]
MKSKISLQQIQIENESTQKRLTNSHNRIIIFLLASSLIEVFWSTTIFEFRIVYKLKLFITIPPIFNIFSWSIYAIKHLTPFFFDKYRFFEKEKEDYNRVEKSTVIKDYQILKYSLYRQEKVERLIISLLIVQFISMSTMIIILFQTKYRL